ncbi:MAG TPA: hypothetical protein GX404_08905 [Syntrophomonadaceae bacterium]|nr:hypothetical protein [Syntrophomonadaceae bacterium]
MIRKVPLDLDDILDFDVYQNAFMPVGDDKQVDIERLIRQKRIHKNL